MALEEPSRLNLLDYRTNDFPLLMMTAYSLNTASKGCVTAVTLTITMAGDVGDNRDNSAYIIVTQ